MTLTSTAVITFVLTYIFVKKKLASAGKQLIAAANTAVDPSSQADLKMQPNPSYGTSHKVTMDTNPAYESCK